MTRLLFILLWIFPYVMTSQTNWESIILEGDEWRYIVPNEEIQEQWTSIAFNDASWFIGNSGFGYGDDDDETELPAIQSIFIRKTFTIDNIDLIRNAILNMDYDDGYVAYLNGVEISRSLMSGNPPLYNQRSDGWHEALLYRGIRPENVRVDTELLREGDNVLAVQVHNENSNSSDLTVIPFLSFELIDTSGLYRPTPSWFRPPISFTASHLPIVKISTNGQLIVDDPKVMAEIRIINNGEASLNQIDDPSNEYQGYCGIEIRGESTQGSEKKSYLFEIWDENGNDIDAGFLNFPEEEDFILYGPYMDKAMINNVLAMKIGREMGYYASRTRFVELVINEDYKGLYVVMERIKRDINRLDIAKLNPEEVSGDDVTGGYIVRLDKGSNDGWHSKYNASNGNNKLFFQYFVPDEEDIVEEQKTYIRDYFDGFEDAVGAANYVNSEGKSYTDYIHLRSFIDNFIINELSKNVDAYRLSSYFHKDKDSKGGKIVAGPIWDYNLSFGNADYCGGDLIEGWIYQQCDHGGIPFWWNRFIQDDFFRNGLRCRWESLRSDILSTEHLFEAIDSMVAEMGDAAQRNYERWPTLGIYIWPNPFYFFQLTEHAAIVETMKSRLLQRIDWMDLNMPGIAENCVFYDEFDIINTSHVDPEIVTSRVSIFPNPFASYLYIEGENLLKRIEIYNMLGQRVYSKNVNSKTASIELGARMKSGSYLVRIEEEEGFTSKVVVKY